MLQLIFCDHKSNLVRHFLVFVYEEFLQKCCKKQSQNVDFFGTFNTNALIVFQSALCSFCFFHPLIPIPTWENFPFEGITSLPL